MRKNIVKGHSTKAERRFHELLKELRIPFRTKIQINGREIDFLIGKYAIEIDGHEQDVLKNQMLASEGFIPIHIYNWKVGPHLKDWIKNIWQMK